MKKKKTIIIISIVLIIVGIISYGIISFISDYRNSKKEMEQSINIINEEYNKFESYITQFSVIRDSIYQEINQIYYETFEEDIKEWNDNFVNYSDIINIIGNFNNTLGDKCINKTYFDINANKKCKDFIESYETIINTYITDIGLYNEHIEKYNEWKSQSNNVDSETKLEKYSNSNINKYIDYNNDGEYLGKE